MSIEDDIRRVLADERYVVEVPADAHGRVRDGIVARRRKRGITAAVAVAVVLAAIPVSIRFAGDGSAVPTPAASSLPRPSSLPTPSPLERPSAIRTPSTLPALAPGPRASTVPWIGEPSYGADAGPSSRPCRAEDLSAPQFDADIGIAQRQVAVVTMRNIGASACTLSGRPVIETKASGSYRRASAGSMQIPALGRTPAMIEPGQTAKLPLGLAAGCYYAFDPVTVTDLAVMVGTTVIPVPGLTISGACGPFLEVGEWSTDESDASAPAIDPFADLTARMVDVRHDDNPAAFDYVVYLSNPTSHVVSFHDCPEYRETFGENTATFELNCEFEALGPGETVRLLMYMSIDPSLPTGDGQLHWALITPNGEDASTQTKVS